MIWGSILAMTVIDVVILLGAAAVLVSLYRCRVVIMQLNVLKPIVFIVCGIVLISCLYAMDFYTMHIMPLHTTGATAMAAMEALHLNWSWPVMLGGISSIVMGLLFLTGTLFPEVAGVIENLRTEVEERRKVETELRAAQEALVRKERLAALGQLTGTVSHELRNPLGAIRQADRRAARRADSRDRTGVLIMVTGASGRLDGALAEDDPMAAPIRSKLEVPSGNYRDCR